LGVVLGGDNGTVGGKNYPMAKKQHTLEFLREKEHLRPRSKVFSSALRIRNAMAFASHKFFNDRGFVYVHTPLVTAADCEGAGEQFTVTTLLPEEGKGSALPVDKKGNIDYSKDFFGRRCSLTVSGQLNVETHACALSDVYTFGPTFRAENSHTARHLAEFWMIEPEICFADLVDDMALAEDYVRYCTAYALEHCADDLHYFEHEYPMGEKGLQERLRNVADNEFARITYTEAIALLQAHIAEKKVQFYAYPQWGDDLGSEHERYICEKVYQKPTIVINYPKGIKAFYMKLNDDQETVAAMDVLVPKIGELIGGSQRLVDFTHLIGD
jgi:asparaginyl-tRNA synthetase